MLDMAPCPTCHGAKVRKESLHVFLTLPEKYIPTSFSKDNLFINKGAHIK
jgi:hypothetical protein